MNISDKFKEYWKAKSEEEKVSLIKDQAIQLNKWSKSMNKAVKAEYEHGFNRVGVRGGKFTSLNAKACNSTTMYLNCMDELRYMVGEL